MMEITPTKSLYRERDHVFVSSMHPDEIELRIGADRFSDPGSRRTVLTLEDADCVIAALQWEIAQTRQRATATAQTPVSQ